MGIENVNKKRYKALLLDSIAFAISNFASKILVFLLVPLYTNILSTADYGIADLITNTVNLLYPILTLSIMEATLRFSFEKDISKDDVLINSLFVVGIAEAILIGLTPIVQRYFESLGTYWAWFLIIFLGFNLQQVFSQFVKGIGETNVFAISGIIQTFIIVIANIIGLLVLNGGLYAYLFSIILGYFVCIIYLVFAARIRVKKFSINISVLKGMLRYSTPMIPTLVSWWVSSSADKYIIISCLGLSISGIYSVAYKIPSVLTLFTNIFTSAWTISAIQSTDCSDKENYQATVYKYFNALNVIVGSLLIILSKVIGRLLYAKEFFTAWHCVPFLLIAYVFAGLSGFLASSFRAEKKTAGLFWSSCIGAIINIVLNLIVIPYFGIIGAAFTTLIGFAVTFFLRESAIKKFLNIRIESKKNNFAYLILIGQSFVMSYEVPGYYLISFIAVLIVVFVYKDVVLSICLSIFSSIRKIINRFSEGRND